MKICWDNLEKLRYKYGMWQDNNNCFYIYKDFCKNCGESFLAQKNSKGDYCGCSCSKKNKSFSDEHKKRISKSLKGRIFTKEWKEKLSVAGKGKKHSEKSKKKMSDSHIGKTLTEYHKNKIGDANRGKKLPTVGEKH